LKVAAYQAPLLPSGSMQAVDLIRQQVTRCEAAGVEILCCPEAILRGLADYAEKPADIALNPADGQLADVLAPLSSNSVTTIIGFTEATNSGTLYNTATVFHKGQVIGQYRKAYPAINQSVYAAGTQLPIFTVGDLTFGIIICNDSNYIEPARVMAAKGATALFIPTNNALTPAKADVVARSQNTDIARAVENSVSVIRADVSGRQDGLVAYGTTAMIDPDGMILASSRSLTQDLIVADIDTAPRARRWGWDASRNPAVTDAYARLIHEL
jgi:predicted amidohydrolase